MAKADAWCPGVNRTKWDVYTLTYCWIMGGGGKDPLQKEATAGHVFCHGFP